MFGNLRWISAKKQCVLNKNKKNIIKCLVIKKTSLYLHRKIKTPTGRLPGKYYDT